MPANYPIPSVPIVIDRPRNLLYTAAAIARLEEAYDKPISTILGELMAGLRTNQFRFRLLLELLAAGLKHEDAAVTWESIGDSLSFAQVTAAIGPLTEAIRLAFPKDEGASPNAPAASPAE